VPCVLEDFYCGDGASILWYRGKGGVEEFLAEAGESADGGFELRFEGVGFGAEGKDAPIVGLVFRDFRESV
jgi:hypothetical protein